MVPLRKCNEIIQYFVLTSNMAFQQQIQNIHFSGVPVNSPLEEFTVFSDSEDELEYVHEVHGNLTESVYTSKKQNVSIQCDIEKDVKLIDVLKFLSTCDFEKAKRSELDELLKWFSVKYNDIVKMSKTCLSSCKRKSDDEDSESNEVKHSRDITSKSNTPKKLKLTSIIEKENLSTNLHEGTQISNEVNSLESSRPNEDSSKKQIETAQLKRKNKIGGKSNKATVDNHKKKGGSAKTQSHSNQEVENLESLSPNEDSSKKQDKTAQLRKKDIAGNSNKATVENQKKKGGSPKTQLRSNQEVNNLESLSLNEGSSKKQAKRAPLTKKKDISGKSNKATVENQKKKGRSPKTQPHSPVSKFASDNLFKQPLVNSKALARNWMHRSHSFNLEETKKVKPHFTSYQSDIKVRKLYSPSEWLNSEEFEKCSQTSN